MGYQLCDKLLYDSTTAFRDMLTLKITEKDLIYFDPKSQVVEPRLVFRERGTKVFWIVISGRDRKAVKYRDDGNQVKILSRMCKTIIKNPTIEELQLRLANDHPAASGDLLRAYSEMADNFYLSCTNRSQ